MKNPVFTGAGVAIITPMYEDGSVNFDELGRIVEDQIAVAPTPSSSAAIPRLRSFWPFPGVSCAGFPTAWRGTALSPKAETG